MYISIISPTIRVQKGNHQLHISYINFDRRIQTKSKYMKTQLEEAKRKTEQGSMQLNYFRSPLNQRMWN